MEDSHIENEQYKVNISVHDTGSGMEPEVLVRLFKPFTQANEKTSLTHGGTGLGLSITRHLATLMGGDASATSKPSEGSTFTFSLVAAKGSPEGRPSNSHVTDTLMRQKLAAGRFNVLVVDDVEVNRMVAEMLLGRLGVIVTTASDGMQALSLLSERTFDLVLLDINMPVMDGFETIERIRAGETSNADQLVIALTANAMQGDRDRMIRAGMDGYLAKPLDERAALTEIYRVLHCKDPILNQLKYSLSCC